MIAFSSSILRRALSVVPVLAAAGALSAQTAPAVQERDSGQLLSALAKQVDELRLEVATLRLAWQEQHLHALETEVRAAERERRLAEYEDAAVHDEILAAEIQLSGSELDDADRAELRRLKDSLLTEGQQRLKLSRTETVERESALRTQWERESETADKLRRTLKSLRGGAPLASFSRDAK